MGSLSLSDLDVTKTPPLVRQESDRVQTKFSKSINTYFYPLGDDLKDIVLQWIEELRTVPSLRPKQSCFPPNEDRQGDDMSFQVAGIEPAHWSDASPVRTIFKEAFTRAGIPYFPPHSFRHTLGHLMQAACRTPEQMRAWSKNLGHENISTTLTSYGKIDPNSGCAMIHRVSNPSLDQRGGLGPSKSLKNSEPGATPVTSR
jgi:integrase